jgi:hypothetical protein
MDSLDHTDMVHEAQLLGYKHLCQIILNKETYSIFVLLLKHNK